VRASRLSLPLRLGRFWSLLHALYEAHALKNPLLIRAPPSFFRPQTTQDLFLNFVRLLEHNNGRVPFASSDTRSGQP
jgi:hypothetical protein